MEYSRETQIDVLSRKDISEMRKSYWVHRRAAFTMHMTIEKLLNKELTRREFDDESLTDFYDLRRKLDIVYWKLHGGYELLRRLDVEGGNI